ncbi:LANO_0B06766g1_1 [Lachancea nothofagi CBS 11611]|uniref:Protein-lysine N-methyltransferase EFM4 n=1 Tax=Lachancea nothofagi CBS 11611 TaxID=1266666 RepID=A0A1G4IZU3_9SACH|nr:LANO_0B06766g1_1 [Lachancea nothofagi CBS 11611]
MEDTTKLNTSKLGTKQYWDDFYAVEKSNFEENPEDTGECWFDDSNAEDKMIEFLTDHVGELLVAKDASMIDLGTGNGHLLFQLCDEGFEGKMVGVDYSEKSVEFAREILRANYSDLSNLEFLAADIFDSKWESPKYDIILDKGTLDAIALSGLKSSNGETIVEAYPKVVDKLMKKDSVFLITSCNFTEAELKKMIETDSLVAWETIKYPGFKFGGHEGSTICSVAFVKR